MKHWILLGLDQKNTVCANKYWILTGFYKANSTQDLNKTAAKAGGEKYDQAEKDRKGVRTEWTEYFEGKAFTKIS